MRWSAAVLAALAHLERSLGPRGQWPGRVRTATGTETRDLAAPLTALGALALRNLAATAPAVSNRVDALVRRSAEHLTRTVLPGGLWRYYANIPPDADDTAMCALALGLDHPLARKTAASLAATQLPDGRFPTWFQPGWDPVVDAVANAHVVAVVGPGPATDAAVDWLREVVAAEREATSSAYYPDPLDLHVALTRAMTAGVDALGSAVAAAAPRALDRLSAGTTSAYRTAQALLVATHPRAVGVAADAAATVPAAADRLVCLQRQDGSWPEDTLFVATGTDDDGDRQYRSAAVVTALSAAALVAADTWARGPGERTRG